MATEILHLSFRMMTEKTFSHSMDSSLLISDVKTIIETDSEIAPENQRLIFKGQLLKDEYTLQSYGLKSGNTIHVVGRVATVPAPEPATSAGSDVPDNVVEPESTTDNTNQNPQGDDQTTEGQTASGNNSGRGIGFPMGIFMSPIYATISVSGPSNVSSGESAMEQVASQFFSGVVNSLLTSFNNGTGTSTNTPSARPTSTPRSQDDELLVDLELSTTVLNRVTRSVKRLNNSPSTPMAPVSSPTVGSNIQFNHSTTSGTESVDSTGEFNNLVSTTGNVDRGNFRTRSPSNSSHPQMVTINLDRENQTEYEEFEGCSGKVLLIDPQVLSSKLPWESLNKLEQVLYDRTSLVESDESNDFNDGFVVTEEFVDTDSKSVPIVNNNDNNYNNMNKDNNEDNETHHVKFNLDEQQPEFQQLEVTEQHETEDNTHVTHDEENVVVDGPEVVEVTETNESLCYEDFMSKFHSFELKLQEIMREYNMGDRSNQLGRFKQLSSAMAIKTRIDVSLCALFSWMQTQMVSTERARAFETNMGWNTTDNSNSTSSNSPETSTNTNDVEPVSPNMAVPLFSTTNNTTSNSSNVDNTNSNNQNNTGNIESTSNRDNNSNLSNTNYSTSGNSSVPEVSLELPLTGSSVNGPGLGTTNNGLTANNPFNITSNNPFANSTTIPFSLFSSNDSSTLYNNRDNTSRQESDVQPLTSRSSSNESSTAQSDLFARYRANPDFASSMARVRQTKLSDSYHS